MNDIGDHKAAISDMDAFIHHLRRKGVMLWLEDFGLRYRARKGVLTPAERQTLSCVSGEVASLLLPRGASVGERGDVRTAPMSFTQLAHWYARRRRGGRPVRHIASAFSLRGPVRVELLRESVKAVGRRHDALRTRIVLREGMLPVQEVAEKYCPELEVIPLDSIPESERQAQVEEQIRHAILDGSNYEDSSLFKAVLLRFDASENVLILALEHVISDVGSLHLLCGEIFIGYAQLCAGRAIDLPQVSIQFPDHAAGLRALSREVLTGVTRRFDLIGRVRFPEDVPGKVPDTRGVLGIIRFSIRRELMDDLRRWARHHGTTIVIATLTAYSAVVLRWCRVSETLISFMTDGRTSAELERTIGFLAFPIYVRVSLVERTTFLDLLRSVTQEYCRARDESDFGYASAQEFRSEFTHCAAMNWWPSRGESICRNSSVACTGLSWSAIRFSNPALELITHWDEEPFVVFSERGETVAGEMMYARDRFSDDSMKRFAESLTEFLAAMLRNPGRRVMDVNLK